MLVIASRASSRRSRTPGGGTRFLPCVIIYDYGVAARTARSRRIFLPRRRNRAQKRDEKSRHRPSPRTLATLLREKSLDVDDAWNIIFRSTPFFMRADVRSSVIAAPSLPIMRVSLAIDGKLRRYRPRLIARDISGNSEPRSSRAGDSCALKSAQFKCTDV